MKKPEIWIILACLPGLMALAGCGSSSRAVVPTVINSTSAPIATPVRRLPTAMPGGESITYKQMQVGMEQAEITGKYVTEFGSEREPPAGSRFLWVQVRLENLGTKEQALPSLDHFSVLFGSSEFKVSYGHRKEHTDYLNLKPTVYQGQIVEAWLRFEIPAEANLRDLQFVYLPESFQVSPALQESNYSWADHPVFFWQCGQ